MKTELRDDRPNLYYPQLTGETITLDTVRLWAAQGVTRQLLEDLERPTARMTVGVHAEALFDQVTIRLVAEVLSERLAVSEQKHTVKVVCEGTTQVPTSWWQDWKRQYEGRWFAWPFRNRPVKWYTRTVRTTGTKRVVLVVEQFAGFPSAPIRTPERIRGPVVQTIERVTVQES